MSVTGNTVGKNIGVFFGGKSPEHDISIITGEMIISGLQGLGYNVIPVYLDKNGFWYSGDKLASLSVFTKGSPEDLKNLDQLYLDLTKSRGKIVLRQKGLVGKEISIDVAFPAFHGMNGEDGTSQGLFEIIGVPYVGCDTAASAIAMDKVTTKLLYQALNIPTVPFVYFFNYQWQKDKKQWLKHIKNKLKYNLIVKPARLGSSIGISKAKSDKELEFALEVAFHYEEKVIVEEAIDHLMDITCCLIGNEDPKPSLLQESAYAQDFFSYDDKYLKGGGAQLGKSQSVVIPARLDKKTTEDIRQTAVNVYRASGCSGIARVDFLYDTKTKKYYANEVNTLPGTLYHHLWKKSGIELDELLSRLLDYAWLRHQAKQELTYTFSSSVLSQSEGTKLSK